MKQDKSAGMKDDVKSRMGDSVPHPDPASKLSERDRRALELQGEVEHATGERREEIVHRAEEADAQKKSGT